MAADLTTTKRCPDCGVTKDAGAFNRASRRRDGLRTYCKECESRRYREARERNPERHRDLAKARAKAYRERRRSEHRETMRRIYYAKPEQAEARRAVRYALERGDLKRPDDCSRCGSSARAIQAHHPDYAKPLEVEWLCAPCHKELHLNGS